MSNFPTSFKALKTQESGALSVVDVAFEDWDKNLGPDRVLLKVLAVGLNPTDWKHALGPWLPSPFRSVVCGCDAVGEVVALGRNVSHLAIGDRVGGFMKGTGDEKNGAYAEYVELRKQVCFKLPEAMRSVEGAAFPIPHLTAVQALYGRLGLSLPSSPSKEGKTVLIWGGSTAVGHHLVQLASQSGYRVFVTASPSSHATLRSIGAEQCFDYRDANVVQAIKAASNGGVFFAVDTVSENGTPESTIDSIQASGGHVVTILPISDEIANRRANVKAEFTLVYTMLGYDFTFANAMDFAESKEDAALAQSWCENEFAAVVAGWKSGEGNGEYTGQKLRELQGGLAGVIKGLEIMKAGDYRAEKLVAEL